MHWQTSRYQIDLTHARIMGIVNITPDSFSGAGNSENSLLAIKHAQSLLEQGADILDLGAESTRPGAVPLPLDEELARLIPVLAEVVRWNIPISVDTYKPEVMQIALDMGADIINDINALRGAGAQAAIVQHSQCGVCLMHMHLEPQTMQIAPMEGADNEVVVQVRDFLHQRASALEAAGVAPSRICLDPGIGFGKTVTQNFALLELQNELLALGYPILAGWSRKSSLGAVTGLPPEARMLPSVVAAVLAVQNGAKIVRVHDVAETKAGLQVLRAASMGLK